MTHELDTPHGASRAARRLLRSTFAAMSVILWLSACGGAPVKTKCLSQSDCFTGLVCVEQQCVSPRGDVPDVELASNQPMEPLATSVPSPLGVSAVKEGWRDHDDIEPVLALVDKQTPVSTAMGLVVALGPIVQTSAALDEMMLKTTRALIEERGFRTVAVTSDWSTIAVAAAYVSACVGSDVDAMQSLSPLYHNLAIREFVRWLCEWNAQHGSDPVRLIGFDVAEPWRDVAAIKQVLQEPAQLDPTLIGQLNRCSSSEVRSPSDLGDTTTVGKLLRGDEALPLQAFDACQAQLQRIDSAVANLPEAARISGQLAVASYRAWERYVYFRSRRDEASAYEAWEEGNAVVLAMQLGRPQMQPSPRVQKTVVWTNALGAAKQARNIGGLFERSVQGVRGYLAPRMNGRFVGVLLTASEVQTRLSSIGTLKAVVSDHALERQLQRAAADVESTRCFVSLDANAWDAALLEPGRLYQVVGGLTLDPFEQYDGILYARLSAPMAYSH